LTDIHTKTSRTNKKAKEILTRLLIEKAELNSKLESNYSNPDLQKELRTINMDIRITENEIEHTEFRINEYEINPNANI
jgi:hypothetical protein